MILETNNTLTGLSPITPPPTTSVTTWSGSTVRPLHNMRVKIVSRGLAETEESRQSGHGWPVA